MPRRSPARSRRTISSAVLPASVSSPYRSLPMLTSLRVALSLYAGAPASHGGAIYTNCSLRHAWAGLGGQRQADGFSPLAARTCADLAAVTADLPAGLGAAKPRIPPSRRSRCGVLPDVLRELA